MMFELMRVAVLIIILAPTQTQAQIVVEESQLDHVPIAEMALQMTRRFISPKTNTVVIMEKCKYCAARKQNFHARLLDHFLKNFDALMTLQLFSGRPDDKPWDYNIFIVDSMLAFDELRFNFPETIHDREFYFFVVLTISTNDRHVLKFFMRNIFETCRRFNVLNAVIMTEYSSSNFGFYTYRMFDATCTPGIRVERFNRFRNGRLDHDYLFPERLRQFFNCSINVTAQVLYPFLNYFGDTKNTNLDMLSGIEGDLLKILSDVLNFSISLSIPEEHSTIGLHGDSTGCFAELRPHRAEIAIGGFSSFQPNRSVFSGSVVYHQSSIVFIVRSGLHFRPMKQLALPFKPRLWGVMAIVLSIAICFIKCVDWFATTTVRNFVMGSQNNKPAFNLLIVYLGNPLTQLPKRNFARFLLMSWMLATLILRNAYQGKMFDALRLSRRIPLPDSLNELIDKKYILLAKDYFDFYPANMTYILQNMTNRFSEVQDSTRRYTTPATIDTLSYFNRFRRDTSRLSFVDEPIYTYQCVMYFRKHSVLKHRFDHAIKKLMDAGITSYIYKQHVSTKFRNLNDGPDSVSGISNRTLSGIYMIYGMLINIALYIFICELLSRRYKILRRIFDWCH